MHSMDLFNKTFFRFAFGLLGIILLSVAMIFIASAFTHEGGLKPCTTDCAHR
jgi:disulfide bond formation protein DsbB